MTPLGIYLSTALHAWCPVSDHAFREAAAITEARFADIADSIATVASDRDEAPLFAGSDGRVRTAVLLASIASFESGCLRGDVVSCSASGDNGRAFGMFQSHAGRARVCWSLQSATRIALQQLRASFVACEQLEPEHWMSAYCSGSCARGHTQARNRWTRAAEWLRRNPLVGAT